MLLHVDNCVETNIGHSKGYKKNTLEAKCFPLPPLPRFPGDGDAIQDYLLKITGARSVPRVFVGQQCIGGGTETREAHEKGTLVPTPQESWSSH